MLRAIMLNKKKREIEAQLEDVRVRESELETRESEIAAAIEEIETEEETKAVEESVEEFEKEKSELADEKKELEKKLAEIDKELEETEKKTNEVKVDVNEETTIEEVVTEEREDLNIMEQRKLFGGITREQAGKLVQREEVKDFLTRTRELKGQNRAVSGSELLIPEVLLGILRDNIHNYSKLISKVNLRQVRGTARMIIPGTIPEAVWTEACARLNELDINFNQAEVDGYKVGGFIAICNATLEDASDVDLYNEIMHMLAQAIGFALDKAIVYGTGTKMPLGIVTRLAQATEPGNYSEIARPWVDLSTTNITAATGEGTELFADLLVKSAAAKGGYSNGTKTWLMNETTLTTIQSKALAFDSSGVVVSGVNKTMPVIGGNIVILPFIPDGDVIGGYLSNYVLAERAGTNLAVSEHVQFIEDNTVFKGTARYDGLPVIAEAFVAINVAGGTVTTTVEFAPDTANTETPEA